MIFLQILILIAVLGVLLGSPPLRGWIRSRTKSDLIVGAGLVGLLLIGHFLCLGKYTFPFVNWSMYAAVNESAEFQTVEIRCTQVDQQESKINPIRSYPSLVHCFTPRFVRLVRAANEDKLTGHGENVYHDLIRSIVDRSPPFDGKIEKIEIYLLTIRKSDRQRLDEELVSTHWYDPEEFKKVVAEHGDIDFFAGTDQ